MYERPAEPFDAPPENSGHKSVRTMIEKTGVTDPECDQIQRRYYYAHRKKKKAFEGVGHAATMGSFSPLNV